MSTPADASSLYQLRPATEADLGFMRRLYASTREEELAVTGWDRGRIDAFFDQQFAAQTAFYREQRPAALWKIITVGATDAGRLLTDRAGNDLRIVDLALLPEFRSRGIGTHILRTLQRSAAESGCRLSIHVECHNPARALYDRLGFAAVGEPVSVYQLMEWRPDA